MKYDKMISSGSIVVDDLLDGGLDKNKIICVYGEAASGKTTLAMLAAIDQAALGKKVLFIDSENGFSIERFKQLSCNNLDLLNNMFIVKVKSFYDQLKKIESLAENYEKFSLIIIDTIGNFYRSEVVKDVFANKQLAKQMDILKQIVGDDIPVLITNQIYTDPVDKTVQVVGGKIIKDNVDCLIELVKLSSGNRACILRKHHVIYEMSEAKASDHDQKSSISNKKEKMFKIVEKGFIPIPL